MKSYFLFHFAADRYKMLILNPFKRYFVSNVSLFRFKRRQSCSAAAYDRVTRHQLHRVAEFKLQYNLSSQNHNLRCVDMLKGAVSLSKEQKKQYGRGRCPHRPCKNKSGLHRIFYPLQAMFNSVQELSCLFLFLFSRFFRFDVFLYASHRKKTASSSY